MYKKYVHPCYSWNNKYLKVLSEDVFITSTGEIISIDVINKYIEDDGKKVEIGDYTPDVKSYGLLDSTKEEFIVRAYDNISELEQSIVKVKNEILRTKELLGINYESK